MSSDTPSRSIGRSNAMVRAGSMPVGWIWEGVLAYGAITLLSAPEKAGKSTLVSLLLDRRREGGELLERAVLPGRSVVASEENDDIWSLRQPPLDFGPDLIFHKPWSIEPTRSGWRQFIDDVWEIPGGATRVNLLVIDTAVAMMPLSHRNKRVQQRTLADVRDLAEQYCAAVLVVNQRRTMHRPLAAFADIVIEMTIPRGQGSTRRRIFTGVGRYPQTLQSVTAELNDEGTDYLVVPEGPSPRQPLLATVQALLAQSPTPLSRQELLSRWPAAPPLPQTLWRVLDRALAAGILVVEGSGTRHDPFRYALASRATGLSARQESSMIE